MKRTYGSQCATSRALKDWRTSSRKNDKSVAPPPKLRLLIVVELSGSELKPLVTLPLNKLSTSTALLSLLQLSDVLMSRLLALMLQVNRTHASSLVVC